VVIALLASMFVWLGWAAGDSAAAPSKVHWSKCHAALGPFECGTVRLPLDYDQQKGATISIALVRLPATDPQRRIGSLFLNPGGPGGSGVDFTLFAGPFLYTDEVRARFDLVGFDPRGTNRSTALRCFGTPKQWGPYFTPFAFPSTPEEEQIWIAADHYLDDACGRRGGRIADHMATANVARDLDVLRQAVGDDKLTYAGVSYGTFLGVTYANLFPETVRAVIVDGVLDPIAWTTGVGGEAATVPFSTRLRGDAGAQATLQEFFRLCDAGGPACAFAPASAARFAALGDKLRQHPVEVTLPDGSVIDLNYSNLIAITLGAMYDSLSWEDFARVLADIEGQADPATLGARLRPFRLRPAYITKRGFPHYPNLVEGFPAVACADSDNPDSYSAWSRAGAAADAEFGYFRTDLDVGIVDLRRLAARRPGPLHRTVRRAHSKPGARDRKPIRSSDPVRGRGDSREPAPGLTLAHPARLGPRLAVPVALRRRAREPLPGGSRPPLAGDRMRAGPRPLHVPMAASSAKPQRDSTSPAA
jgi:pimeloyl-ACP methyl ester carboxylesterase